MQQTIDSGAAPPFVGPTPPTRMEASYAEHLDAALQIFATRDLDETEMSAFKLFMIETDRIIKEKTGQAGAMAGEAAPEENPDIGNQNQEEYGAQNGEEIQESPYA